MRAFLTLAFLLCAGILAAEHVVYIDTLDLTKTECGWRSTAPKKTVDGNPLMLRGKRYDRGVGHHAPGSITIEMPPVSARFYAVVGIDDETNGNGNAEFLVYADGKLLWKSGFLTGKDSPKICDLKLDSVKQIVLSMDTGPEGYGHDHGDWADAKVVIYGEEQLTRGVKTLKKSRGITDESGNEIDRMDEIACEYAALSQELKKGIRPHIAKQALRLESTFLPADKNPIDVVLRRTKALLEYMKTMPNSPNLDAETEKLQSIETQCLKALATDDEQKELFAKIVDLRRQISLKNPLLDFDDILFIKRHVNPEPETQGNHMCDQFFGFHAIQGGGIFVLKNPFAPSGGQASRVSVLDSSYGFLAPELSFDGKTLLFAAADAKLPRHTYQWTEENCYQIYSVNIDGTNLKQLTFGPYNDIDPCFLPNGRIAFISERRGGYGRCHGRPVPSYTLHTMLADGNDITMLSPHETNEWKPSVDNNGMIIYTRWDYVDRGHNQAHHPWITFPDGRDSRALHGNNSPKEHSRPQFETTVRAIPSSQKILAAATLHHGQYFGSVILIDPTIEDDGAMSQIRRVTPEQLFPEVENAAHKDSAHYGQPYPLSEDFYLVVYDAFSNMGIGPANNYGLYLLDSFGNKTLLYRDPDISVQCPIPLRNRFVPPVMPHQTLVGLPLGPGETLMPIDKELQPKTGVVGVTNVYQTRYNLPPDKRIKELRIVQLLPKTTPYAHNPAIGYGDQKGARAILGTVPVESDGSAHFKLPVDIPVYFQALDENGQALQWMRSATYVKPGEQLFCTGCHENRHTSAINAAQYPIAMQREPSEIHPESDGTKPFSYPRLIQPIWNKHCVDCHETEAQNGKTFRLGIGNENSHFFESYKNLRPYVFFYDNAAWVESQTRPGTFGTQASKLWHVLEKGHYNVLLSPLEKRNIMLWLDNNADFYGVYEHESLPKQRRGEIVMPSLE